MLLVEFSQVNTMCEDLLDIIERTAYKPTLANLSDWLTLHGFDGLSASIKPGAFCWCFVAERIKPCPGADLPYLCYPGITRKGRFWDVIDCQASYTEDTAINCTLG